MRQLKGELPPDGYHNEVDCFSSGRSTPRARLSQACRQLSAIIAELRTVTGQMMEESRLKGEMKQKVRDVPNELDHAKSKIMQFECHENRRQVHVDRILEPAGRLEAGIEKDRNEKIKHFLSDLRDYLTAVLTASEAPTTIHSGLPAGSVARTATRTIDV